MVPGRNTYFGRRAWLIIDSLLVVAALASVLWACQGRPRIGNPRAPRIVHLRGDASGAKQTIFIDSTNQIHVGAERFASADRLCSYLTPAPDSVLLLVHPDGLLENVMRTISALRHSGVREIQLGTSESSSIGLSLPDEHQPPPHTHHPNTQCSTTRDKKYPAWHRMP